MFLRACFRASPNTCDDSALRCASAFLPNPTQPCATAAASTVTTEPQHPYVHPDVNSIRTTTGSCSGSNLHKPICDHLVAHNNMGSFLTHSTPLRVATVTCSPLNRQSQTSSSCPPRPGCHPTLSQSQSLSKVPTTWPSPPSCPVAHTPSLQFLSAMQPHPPHKAHPPSSPTSYHSATTCQHHAMLSDDPGNPQSAPTSSLTSGSLIRLDPLSPRADIQAAIGSKEVSKVASDSCGLLRGGHCPSGPHPTADFPAACSASGGPGHAANTLVQPEAGIEALAEVDVRPEAGAGAGASTVQLVYGEAASEKDKELHRRPALAVADQVPGTAPQPSPPGPKTYLTPLPAAGLDAAPAELPPKALLDPSAASEGVSARAGLLLAALHSLVPREPSGRLPRGVSQRKSLELGGGAGSSQASPTPPARRAVAGRGLQSHGSSGHNNSGISPCEARRTSTLRRTVVSGTCNAQQQSEHVLLLACGRDDGSRDDWIPLSASGAAAGASASPAAVLRLKGARVCGAWGLWGLRGAIAGHHIRPCTGWSRCWLQDGRSRRRSTCPAGGFQPAGLVGCSRSSSSSHGYWPCTAELTQVVRCSSISTTLPRSWSVPLGLHTTLQQARSTASAPHPPPVPMLVAPKKTTSCLARPWRSMDTSTMSFSNYSHAHKAHT
ncbi:hypothetical protein QJQ45_026109 [Haematococcus lacustris]|nr:hypothetical protein QJQ45_026109 [Haematococcus lacustris]